MHITGREFKALVALKKSADGFSEIKDGLIWKGVLVSNAKPRSWSNPEWRAVLGSLTKKGFYRPADGDFGLVKYGETGG